MATLVTSGALTNMTIDFDDFGKNNLCIDFYVQWHLAVDSNVTLILMRDPNAGKIEKGINGTWARSGEMLQLQNRHSRWPCMRMWGRPQIL